MRWLFACALVACGSAPAPVAPTVTAADPNAINVLLDGWHAAAARADENAYFAALAPNAVFLGTDGTERWSKDAFLAYAHPHFAKGKAWTFQSTRRTVTFSASGDVAWFEEDLASQHLGPSRGSGVCTHDPAGWHIAQYNLSVPIPNEKFDQVKDVIAGQKAAPPPPPPAAPAPVPTPTTPTTTAPGKPEPAVCVGARALPPNSPARKRMEMQCRAVGGTP